MKLKALILSSLLAVAGCEKSSNVAAMQDEVTAVTAHYKHRFDEMSKRLSTLEQRGRTIVSVGEPTGLADVRRLFVDTNKRLVELRNSATQATGAISTAAKSENARLELTKLRDELHERFEKGEVEVNQQIDQVEQWLAYIAYRPTVTAAAEPPKTEPVPAPPQPENPETTKPDGTPADGPAKETEPKTDAPKADAKADPKKDAPKTDAKAEPKKDAPKTDPKKPAAGSGSGSGR